MGVVVDSSIFIARQRNRFDWRGGADSLGDAELLVTTITLSEMLHGAHRAHTAAQRERRLHFSARLERDYRIVPFGIREAHEHASLTAELQRGGITAGVHDLLIGATARCHAHW